MENDLEIIYQEIVPQQEKLRGSFDTKKLAVDNWYKSLHLINTAETQERISLVLTEVNQLQVPYDERKYLLDLLYEPVISLAGHVKKTYLDTKFPLAAEDKEKVNNCIKLYNQLIVGHSIILLELVDNRTRRFLSIITGRQKKELAETIQVITRYLTQIVLTNFEVYNQAPSAIWEKLYALYQFSEKKKIDNLMVTDKMLRAETSVKLTFLQSLLLSLADPYHFNQQQIYFIYKHLAHWAKFVKMSSEDKSKDTNFSAVNLTEEFMPTFFPRGKEPKRSDMLYLDSHELTIERINESEEEVGGFLSPKIKEALLSQLKVSLAVFVERKHDRREFFSEVKIVMGINHVHYVLNNYQNPEWVSNANFESKISDEEDIDYGALNSLNSLLSPSKPPEPLKIETFLTENASLNGLSLVWVSPESVKLNIGEVVAVSHSKEDKPNQWAVAVIRRIQYGDNQPLRVGIQIISSHKTKAIGVMRPDEFKKYRALYLPATDKFSAQPTILTDALTFNENELLKIVPCSKTVAGAPERTIRLMQNKETTSFYMRFELGLENN
ncbi:MAG: hypothetical protein HQL46_01935 [Gammaproteobacteria bacterium]|nr:hypothetical protein [Gammaproteobacteria bacterium]